MNTIKSNSPAARPVSPAGVQQGTQAANPGAGIGQQHVYETRTQAHGFVTWYNDIPVINAKSI